MDNTRRVERFERSLGEALGADTAGRARWVDPRQAPVCELGGYRYTDTPSGTLMEIVDNQDGSFVNRPLHS